MKIIGHASVLLALAVSLYAAFGFLVAGVRGSRKLAEGARKAVQAVALPVTGASLSLICLLLQRDFSVEYVFRHTSTTLSPLYAFSAFWAGQEGSLLLWLWLLSIMAFMVSLEPGEEGVRDHALAVLAGVEAFLALAVAFLSNPFAPSPHPSSEGMGLNPLLENFSMVVHPPTIFAGYAAATIPFAYALACLLAGKPFEESIGKARGWATVAWAFLGAGIIIGGWWAYTELGWGGYWAWDPVENSSLIPWLTLTAFLHSAVVAERRHYLRGWSFLFLTLSFLSCLFAAFLTRSGIIRSVHAFAESSLGLYFVALIALWAAIAGAVAFRRRESLSGGEAESSLLSKDTAFHLLNWFFFWEAVVLLLGIVFPVLSLLFLGREASVGAPFYQQAFMPLAALTVFLMGACAGLGWRTTAPGPWLRYLIPPAAGFLLGLLISLTLGERRAFPILSWGVVGFAGIGAIRELAKGFRESIGRRRFIPRPYGGYLAHMGVILLALGIAGSSFYKAEALVSLRPGETVEVGRYSLRYVGFQHWSLPAKERFRAELELYRGGRLVGKICTERNFHYNVKQWVSEIGLRSTPAEDLYVSMVALEQDGTASFRVEVNPLVFWIWAGGGLLVLGGVLSLCPGRG